MWHNVLWIGGIGLGPPLALGLYAVGAASVTAGLFTIPAFCLVLIVGAENSSKGRKEPVLSSHDRHHSIHGES